MSAKKTLQSLLDRLQALDAEIEHQANELEDYLCELEELVDDKRNEIQETIDRANHIKTEIVSTLANLRDQDGDELEDFAYDVKTEYELDVDFNVYVNLEHGPVADTLSEHGVIVSDLMEAE